MKKIYLAALILAVLTGIAVYFFAASLQKAAQKDYTDVVVAAVKISEKTVITKEMLTIKKIPTEAVHPFAVRKIEDAQGYFSDSNLEIDEPLLSSKLHKKGEKTSGLTYFVPQGKRAMTLEVDAVSGVGGFILPGDRVDILSVMVLGKAGDKENQVPTSFIAVQNIEVLATGKSIKVDNNGEQTEYTNITVAVTPDEALSINLVAANGQMRLLLRSPLDKNNVNINPKIPELNANVLK